MPVAHAADTLLVATHGAAAFPWDSTGMSEIVTVYVLTEEAEDISWVFDDMDKLLAVLKMKAEGGSWCLGDIMRFEIRCEEMQRDEFESLPDAA